MRIHIFINCHWNEGISGGDKRVLEIMKRWANMQDVEMYVYTSRSFAKLMKDYGLGQEGQSLQSQHKARTVRTVPLVPLLLF